MAGQAPATQSVTLAVACENISTDLHGKLTLHELTDQLTSKSFPSSTARLYAVFGFSRDSPGLMIANRVEVVSADSQTIAFMDFPDVVFRQDQLTQRVVCTLAGVVWPNAGVYTIRFVSRGAVAAALPLHLIQQ